MSCQEWPEIIADMLPHNTERCTGGRMSRHGWWFVRGRGWLSGGGLRMVGRNLDVSLSGEVSGVKGGGDGDTCGG